MSRDAAPHQRRPAAAFSGAYANVALPSVQRAHAGAYLVELERKAIDLRHALADLAQHPLRAIHVAAQRVLGKDAQGRRWTALKLDPDTLPHGHAALKAARR